MAQFRVVSPGTAENPERLASIHATHGHLVVFGWGPLKLSSFLFRSYRIIPNTLVWILTRIRGKYYLIAGIKTVTGFLINVFFKYNKLYKQTKQYFSLFICVAYLRSILFTLINSMSKQMHFKSILDHFLAAFCPLPIRLSVCVSVSVCLFLCLFICPSVCLSTYNTVCLSICPPSCPSNGLSFNYQDLCTF